MWTAAFWKALAERAVRGGAAGVVAGWSGDAVFNVMEVQNAKDVLALFVSGAVFSGFLSLAGNVVTKSGPSFNQAETVDPVAQIPPQA
jgi:hypothetical protein